MKKGDFKEFFNNVSICSEFFFLFDRLKGVLMKSLKWVWRALIVCNVLLILLHTVCPCGRLEVF